MVWNKGKTADTDHRVAKNRDSLKSNGNCTGRGKTSESEDERRRKLSEHAKKVGFGGYRAGAGRTKKIRVLDSYGNPTLLQGTYELACSEILHELGIIWIRPKGLKYDTTKNYFADFYLPDFDIWLDPKNDYKAKLDEEKIAKVKIQNNIHLFVLLKHQITKEYIASLVK